MHNHHSYSQLSNKNVDMGKWVQLQKKGFDCSGLDCKAWVLIKLFPEKF